MVIPLKFERLPSVRTENPHQFSSSAVGVFLFKNKIVTVITIITIIILIMTIIIDR